MTVITQFLDVPFDLEGKKASQLMSKKTRRRRRVRPLESGDEGEVRQRKKEKKQKDSAPVVEEIPAHIKDEEAAGKKRKRKSLAPDKESEAPVEKPKSKTGLPVYHLYVRPGFVALGRSVMSVIGTWFTYSAGYCVRVRRPAGAALPVRMSKRAEPPLWPGYPPHTTAFT